MVQGGGFEPPKLSCQIYSLIPLATREPLQKADRVGFLEKWSWREELNPRPADYKSAALPTELRQPNYHSSVLASQKRRRDSRESFMAKQYLNSNFLVSRPVLILLKHVPNLAGSFFPPRRVSA